MNERIKAIGRQAGFAFIEDGVYGQRWYSSRCGLDAAEYEKLAELIVKECVDIANKQFSAASGLDDRDSWTAAEIKKHFGVAE